MTLNEFRAIAPSLQSELEGVFLKYGLKLTGRPAGIDSMAGTVRMTIKLADANLRDAMGKETNPEAEYFKQYASMYGLTPDTLGFPILMAGRWYKVAGMKVHSRARKNILITRDDGKTFVCTADTIKTYVMAAAAKGQK